MLVYFYNKKPVMITFFFIFLIFGDQLIFLLTWKLFYQF